MRRSRCRRSGRGQGTRSKTTRRRARPGDVDAVAHGVGAEKAGVGLGAEDVDEGRVVHGVDVLAEEEQAGVFEGAGDAAVDVLEAADSGEEAERAAV